MEIFFHRSSPPVGRLARRRNGCQPTWPRRGFDDVTPRKNDIPAGAYHIRDWKSVIFNQVKKSKSGSKYWTEWLVINIQHFKLCKIWGWSTFPQRKICHPHPGWSVPHMILKNCVQYFYQLKKSVTGFQTGENPLWSGFQKSTQSKKHLIYVNEKKTLTLN